ncbi:F-box/WD repeat-containing protein 1A [Paramyrothecium foliicola]|nr:F-box/WD repeat-containing protein 1A [Paramyrothecium foliicola]
MAKRDQLSPMDHFSPVHQPDEGYSEDPLNPTPHFDLPVLLSTLRSPSDLPAWLASNAAVLPVKVRTELTMALLDELPTSAIAEIVQRLNPRLYIDFIRYLPPEICLKVLSYLDPVSLVSVLQTCRAWYDLALDRKLWERLYYMEGWKAIRSEIDAWEVKVNAGMNTSISHLHRIQTSEGHTSKIRALLNDDEDLEMADSDRQTSTNGNVTGETPVLSPHSSFSSNRPSGGLFGDMDVDSSSSKGKSIDRSLSTSDSRGKRKELDDAHMVSLPPILPSDVPGSITKSTLGMWDVNGSRYRINWKYLYNMRRRLESNWELGKYTTFQLPHPNFPEEGHQECVYTIQFDTNYLVSGSRDQTMRIWNIHSRRLARPPLTGHSGSVLCLQFDADPDEDLLVSGSSDSNVFIWKFSTGELLQKITRAHRESVLNVRFDNRVLVTSSKDKTIKIFNRRPLRYGDVGYGPHDPVVNPVATNLRRYGYEPDLAQELPIKSPFTMIARLDGHTAAVNAIQIRDETIVSVSGDRHIKIWNWPKEVCTKTIPAHEKGIACVEYDGRRIVSGSSDYEVCIFDAPTGLKVAQLRGHAHLVRTVQAGFGDLPYSQTEDEAEAKAVDARYFKAVESGEIVHEAERRSRHNRRANAGSSRPTEIQATGARIPPGGGGGKKYGRIVSGSYDQSIIIWRRDKEGVWKPAHHLRQEEAAAAAQRQFAPPSGSYPPADGNPIPLHPGVMPANQGPGSAPGSQQLPSIGHLAYLANLPVPGLPEPQSRRSASAYMQLIDQVVPLGLAAVQQTLAQHPTILAYHNYLQGAIEREPSPFVRTLLRQAVAEALVNLQRQRLLNTGGMPPGTPGPSSSMATAGSTSSPSNAADTSHQATSPTGAVSSSHGESAQAANTAAPAVPPSTPAPLNTQNLQQVPAAAAAQTPLLGQAQAAAAAHHHPHLAEAEIAPARVFKLQFDARKIVCCSQAPVIVGWDFCNGDAELEEASRFFATVD